MTVLAVDVGAYNVAHACVQLFIPEKEVGEKRPAQPIIIWVLDWQVGCIFPEGAVAAKGTFNDRPTSELTRLTSTYLTSVFKEYPHNVDCLLVEMQDHANRKMTSLSYVTQATLGLLLLPTWEDVVPAMTKVHYVRRRDPTHVPPAQYTKQGITKSQAYTWRKAGLCKFVEEHLRLKITDAKKKDDLCDAILIAVSYTRYGSVLKKMQDEVKFDIQMALEAGKTEDATASI